MNIEQTRRRRDDPRTHIIRFRGQQLPLMDLQLRYAPHLSYDVVRNRIERGWKIEDALFVPLLRKGSRYRGRRIIA